MSRSLDSDQDQRNCWAWSGSKLLTKLKCEQNYIKQFGSKSNTTKCWPDLDSNCLQRLSADECDQSVKQFGLSRSGATLTLNEPQHNFSYKVVCATSKASDQPVHTRSLIRAFASHLNII